MSFVGGKLKLKGGDVPGVKKKKKKDNTGLANALALASADGEGAAGTSKDGEGGSKGKEGSPIPDDLKKVLHGYELAPPDETQDRRTQAEKRHDEKIRKLEEERLRKLAAKSHRERIKEFNDYLTDLSEHHDIPKVGPG